MCALTETLVCEAVSVCVETYEMHLCVNNVCCVYDSCVHVECVYPLRLLCNCISKTYLNCPSVHSFFFLIYSFSFLVYSPLYSWEKMFLCVFCSCLNGKCEILRSFSNKLHSCPTFFPCLGGEVTDTLIYLFIHQIIPIFSFQIPNFQLKAISEIRQAILAKIKAEKSEDARCERPHRSCERKHYYN